MDRQEIKLSFENFKADFCELQNFDDIGWALEILDENLKTFLNKKEEKEE